VVAYEQHVLKSPFIVNNVMCSDDEMDVCDP